MENSQLTVFLNVQPVVPKTNFPIDQTNKVFYLLLIFKKELLNFFIYFIKDVFIYVLMFYEVYLSAVFIFNTLQKCRFFYFQFYKRLAYIIVTFCKRFKN